MDCRFLTILAATAVVVGVAKAGADPKPSRSLKELLQEAEEGYSTDLEKWNSDSYAVSRLAGCHAQPEVHWIIDGRKNEDGKKWEIKLLEFL